MSITFKDIEEICKSKGLKLYTQSNSNARIWKGSIDNGDYVVLSLHVHASGRDIPTGTLTKYAKQLGFNSITELKEFYNSL